MTKRKIDTILIEVLINILIPFILIYLAFLFNLFTGNNLHLAIIFIILIFLNFLKIKKNFSKSIFVLFILLIFLILEFTVLIYDYSSSIFESEEDINTSVSFTPKNHTIEKLNQLYFKQGIINHKLKANDKVIFDVNYFINNKNLREFNYDLNIIKSKKKINFYGGSYTFGHGLNDLDTLTYLFTSESNKYHANNISMLGWGPLEVLNLVEDNDTSKFLYITSNYHINRLSCQFGGLGVKKNVVLKNDLDFAIQGDCRNFLKDKENKIKDNYKKNPFLMYLKDQFKNTKLFSKILIIVDIFEQKFFSKNLRKYIAVILEINKIAKKNNQEFILGYIYDHKYFKKYKYSKKDVINIFLENDIQLLDLSLGFDSEFYRENYTIDKRIELHPNRKANELRAEIINNYLFLKN